MNSFKECYEEYTNKKDEELTKTGIFYAFSDKQFKDNKQPKDAKDNEFISLGAGAYIHQSNKDKLDNFFNVVVKQLKQELASKVDIEDLILYELNNYECFYTQEPLEILDFIREYYQDKREEELKDLILAVYNKHNK